MALTDKDRDELLGRISRKIESSAVLNGGFDKLVSVVDHIKQRQEEQSEKLDQINTRLYEPKDGLFSRVQQLENDVHIADTRLEGHDKTEEDNFKMIEKHLEKIESIKKTSEDTALITKRLQRIGGEDLQDIEKMVSLNKRMTAIFWAMISLAASALANLAWNLIAHK
jgi:DNA repair exonuclease SbcCD ATPase subunit